METFAALKSIFEPYIDDLAVKTDDDRTLYLEKSGGTAKPEMFGAVMVKKNYVSFHYMPVYLAPDYLDGVSADLRKRMQGKSCFNFTRADDPTISELRSLVERTARDHI